MKMDAKYLDLLYTPLMYGYFLHFNQPIFEFLLVYLFCFLIIGKHLFQIFLGESSAKLKISFNNGQYLLWIFLGFLFNLGYEFLFRVILRNSYPVVYFILAEWIILISVLKRIEYTKISILSFPTLTILMLPMFFIIYNYIRFMPFPYLNAWDYFYYQSLASDLFTGLNSFNSYYPDGFEPIVFPLFNLFFLDITYSPFYNGVELYKIGQICFTLYIIALTYFTLKNLSKNKILASFSALMFGYLNLKYALGSTYYLPSTLCVIILLFNLFLISVLNNSKTQPIDADLSKIANKLIYGVIFINALLQIYTHFYLGLFSFIFSILSIEFINPTPYIQKIFRKLSQNHLQYMKLLFAFTIFLPFLIAPTFFGDAIYRLLSGFIVDLSWDISQKLGFFNDLGVIFWTVYILGIAITIYNWIVSERLIFLFIFFLNLSYFYPYPITYRVLPLILLGNLFSLNYVLNTSTTKNIVLKIYMKIEYRIEDSRFSPIWIWKYRKMLFFFILILYSFSFCSIPPLDPHYRVLENGTYYSSRYTSDEFEAGVFIYERLNGVVPSDTLLFGDPVSKHIFSGTFGLNFSSSSKFLSEYNNTYPAALSDESFNSVFEIKYEQIILFLNPRCFNWFQTNGSTDRSVISREIVNPAIYSYFSGNGQLLFENSEVLIVTLTQS